jgi:hypothetical protein
MIKAKQQKRRSLEMLPKGSDTGWETGLGAEHGTGLSLEGFTEVAKKRKARDNHVQALKRRAKRRDS